MLWMFANWLPRSRDAALEKEGDDASVLVAAGEVVTARTEVGAGVVEMGVMGAEGVGALESENTIFWSEERAMPVSSPPNDGREEIESVERSNPPPMSPRMADMTGSAKTSESMSFPAMAAV